MHSGNNSWEGPVSAQGGCNLGSQLLSLLLSLVPEE